MPSHEFLQGVDVDGTDDCWGWHAPPDQKLPVASVAGCASVCELYQLLGREDRGVEFGRVDYSQDGTFTCPDSSMKWGYRRLGSGDERCFDLCLCSVVLEMF